MDRPERAPGLGVNDRYSDDKIAPVLSVLRTKAVLDALAKWNGRVPRTLLLAPDLLSAGVAALVTKTTTTTGRQGARA